ncbi:hypothetical protein HER32_03330 [Hymenobacter sp. BT18]|uniref:hypothetical protein n=1 Tax=Hymenobacter sp. BT18 TaxID=2835648 RepID=UPI00143E8A83|nr:hypothetical protein [Hymenobacter sp. BT18]QIX60272.1 hypothetical protein HER32_03330 [Hymenobacter sp. BT18]
MATSQHPTGPLDSETENEERARNFQPEGRQGAGSPEALRGLNADDNSGSGGTEGGKPIQGKNVSPEAEGPIGGGTASSGTGVSGGATGQVTL